MYYVSSRFFFFFSTAVFFPFSPRLFLTYPQRHNSPHHTRPPYLRFVSSFLFLYALQCINTFLHIWLCAKSLPPDKTHNSFQWHMFRIHVAPQALGTVHYLSLLLVTSFLHNYCGGRGRLARSLRMYDSYGCCQGEHQQHIFFNM